MKKITYQSFQMIMNELFESQKWVPPFTHIVKKEYFMPPEFGNLKS